MNVCFVANGLKDNIIIINRILAINHCHLYHNFIDLVSMILVHLNAIMIIKTFIYHLKIIYYSINSRPEFYLKHNFYYHFYQKPNSFVREKFINCVKNQLYNIDNNDIKYKFKINISDNDTNNLIAQSIWRPNVALSIVEYQPLFYSVFKQLGNSTSNSKNKFCNVFFEFVYFILVIFY